MALSTEETYLGDSVYVSFDGWQYCLRVPRDGGDYVVYLDLYVFEALLDYHNRTLEFLRKAEGKE
jgi:hypothetical protein